jgi:hypothetical protein
LPAAGAVFDAVRAGCLPYCATKTKRPDGINPIRPVVAPVRRACAVYACRTEGVSCVGRANKAQSGMKWKKNP